MELDNQLTDPPFCILQIAGSELSLELVDFLLGLLKVASRYAQFVLWRLAVCISDGHTNGHSSAYHGEG
jgi:hypothetical protein